MAGCLYGLRMDVRTNRAKLSLLKSGRERVIESDG